MKLHEWEEKKRKKKIYVQREIQCLFRTTASESSSIILISVDVETSRYEPDITSEKANISFAVSANFTLSLLRVLSMCSYRFHLFTTSGSAFIFSVVLLRILSMIFISESISKKLCYTKSPLVTLERLQKHPGSLCWSHNPECHRWSNKSLITTDAWYCFLRQLLVYAYIFY